MTDKPLNELNKLKKDMLDKQIKDPIQLQRRCRQIWQNLATEEDVSILNQSLSILNELIERAQLNPYYRALLATTAGAIIEQGKADTMIVFNSILSLFMTALLMGRDILKVKKEKNQSIDSGINEELKKKYPDASYAWAVLDVVSEPMKSMLIMSKKARQAVKDHEKYDDIINSINSYKNYHSGVYYVYTTMNIMDGEILVFHPQSFRGYKVQVTDMIDPMILSHLCTKNLTGNPDEGLIPAKDNIGTTQFALFNWKLINYLYKEGTEPGSKTWAKNGMDLMKHNDAYIESGGTMKEVLKFNNEIPILFLVDYGTPFNFEIYNLGKIKPEMKLVKKMDKKDVEKWFGKLKS